MVPVIVRSGESVVLVTACTAPEPKPNANFFPLTVDYREYTYSAGTFSPAASSSAKASDLLRKKLSPAA